MATKYLRQFIIFLITTLRPLLGTAHCAYADIGCTQFAIIQLQEKNIIKALLLIARRVLLCNPLGFYLTRNKA